LRQGCLPQPAGLFARLPAVQVLRIAEAPENPLSGSALDACYSAATRPPGNATSTRVPVFTALLILKLARLASASALVSGRPRPVPPEPQRADVASWRNGSLATAVSCSLMPTPVSRTRKTISPSSLRAVETITCPPTPVNLIELESR